MLTISMRATWHPSVPDPRRRHLTADKVFRSSDGKARHLISFKFKSAADMANLQIESPQLLGQGQLRGHHLAIILIYNVYLVGSIVLARLIHLGTAFPLFISHPSDAGTISGSLTPKKVSSRGFYEC